MGGGGRARLDEKIIEDEKAQPDLDFLACLGPLR